MNQKQATNYMCETIRNTLSAMREMKIIDQEGVKSVMSMLDHNLETSKIRMKYEKAEEIVEKSKNTFVGVKLG